MNISLVFIIQFYFFVSFFSVKEFRLNSKHYLIMKIHRKRDLKNIATNHYADIIYQDFINIYRKYTSEPYSFLTVNTIVPTNNSIRLRKNLLESL